MDVSEDSKIFCAHVTKTRNDIGDWRWEWEKKGRADKLIKGLNKAQIASYIRVFKHTIRSKTIA